MQVLFINKFKFYITNKDCDTFELLLRSNMPSSTANHKSPTASKRRAQTQSTAHTVHQICLQPAILRLVHIAFVVIKRRRQVAYPVLIIVDLNSVAKTLPRRTPHRVAQHSNAQKHPRSDGAQRHGREKLLVLLRAHIQIAKRLLEPKDQLSLAIVQPELQTQLTLALESDPANLLLASINSEIRGRSRTNV